MKVSRGLKKKRDADIAHLIGTEGWSYKEVAAHVGLSTGRVGVIAKQQGVAAGNDKVHREPIERNRAIVEQYRAGATQMQLGEKYGISRERVRQIVRKHGVLSAERGREQQQREAAERQQQRETERQAERRRRIESKYDLPLEEFEEIVRMERRMRYYRRPRNAYFSFRHNRLFRGLAFELTFGAWWRVWQASGKWSHRGRNRYRYVMTRIDHRLPYREDNVVIVTKQEASRMFWRQVERGEIANPAAHLYPEEA